ncbi:CLUMA_CG012132, isoform A [Clunio marinus]|uniref:CLUMA_CG012132, isoform A n=1 Tax=Clunio marinus TaxID=568069 RepID=A0A1J1IF72_9DIPT|nr:CLUMA_CG012132, isoform A [Clunio marinus]
MHCRKITSLPGLSLEERQKRNHHVPQSFFYQNGHRQFRGPSVGIGKEPLQETFKDFCSASEPIEYDPALIYGQRKKQQVTPFRPHFVLYDKKTLKFMAFFRQHVPDSRMEHYRVRHVNIFYYLEDDTVAAFEPLVKNCGLSQGKLVRRGKIAKTSQPGFFYTWKDFNVGNDVELNGIIFHIADCDTFTREFLTANGIEVNERECIPKDPVSIEKMVQQAQQALKHKTPSNDDKLRRFLEYSGMNLCFDCVLDETQRPGGELITFKMYYSLEDDTVAIRELPENQQGRDVSGMLLKRTKLPKDWRKTPIDFPAIIFNTTEAEIDEYYQPRDFIIGNTIFVFGRKFLLLDCDKFTRNYFDKVLRCVQPGKLEIQKPKPSQIKLKLPDYLGLGTPEDSLASCYSLIPRTPKKDVTSYLINSNKTLRYGCRIETAHPEDKDRRFIMSYNLSDGSIKIMEFPSLGISGGKFLTSQKVPRPDSNPHKPDYYTPKDLYIGAIIKVYATRFVITSADLFVYRYMQAHPELFSPMIIDNVRMYHLKEGNLRDDIQKAIKEDHEKYIAEVETKSNISDAIHDAMTERVPELVTGKRIPSPYISEDEVKKEYHGKEDKYKLPCNINIKNEDTILSDTGRVRFLEPHEE